MFFCYITRSLTCAITGPRSRSFFTTNFYQEVPTGAATIWGSKRSTAGSDRHSVPASGGGGRTPTENRAADVPVGRGRRNVHPTDPAETAEHSAEAGRAATYGSGADPGSRRRRVGRPVGGRLDRAHGTRATTNAGHATTEAPARTRRDSPVRRRPRSRQYAQATAWTHRKPGPNGSGRCVQQHQAARQHSAADKVSGSSGPRCHRSLREKKSLRRLRG